MNRLRYGGAAAVVAILAAGCDSPVAPDEPSPVVVATETATATETARVPPPTSTETDVLIPGALVGRWQSTDEGDAELIYDFAADGGYKHAGVLLQQQPAGVFSFIVEEAGTAEVDDDSLILRPERGKRTLNDPNSGSGPKEQPLDLSPQRLSWEIRDGLLVLEGADRRPITYRRL
jgi:hypothetical protein